MAGDFHKLEVWQRSISFVSAIYAITATFPREEIYGLTSQIRRASVSIPSNIAEGRANRTTKEYLRFVAIASGSAAELETQLVISHNLNFLSQENFNHLNDELQVLARMLSAMYSALEKKLA